MEDDTLDNTQRIALDIKKKIETSNYEERQAMLDELYSKWIIKSNRYNSFFNYLEIAIKNFNLEIENLQYGVFERAKKTIIYQLTYLRVYFEKDELSENDKNIYEEKFTKLFRSVIDADNAISSSLFLMSSMTLEDIGKEKKTKHDLFRYTEINYEKLNPWQTLLLYLADQLQRKGYRRYMIGNEGSCYEKIYNERGYNTHSWRQVMSIKEFIQDQTRKEYNFAMWQNLTHSKENLGSCVKYFEESTDPEFEDLNKQRSVYSFNNGIYITEKWNDDEDKWEDKWIPFEGPGSAKIGESIVSCKLFNMEFEHCEHEDWFDIIKEKCPFFRHVMEDQRWPEEAQRWMCILLGRMLYTVGKHDDWQVMPFLLGMAGTGKSLGYNTPVMLFNGRLKMSQDIEVGDKLMGDDSTPRDVVATSKGLDKLYLVKQSNGDDYVVNGAHILSLKSGINTVDISVDEYLALDICIRTKLRGYKAPIIFKETKTSIDPFIIGQQLGNEDRLVMPSSYKFNSPENHLKLLAGIFDTNGLYDYTNHWFVCFHSSQAVAKDAEYVARCLGFNSRIEKYESIETYYRHYVSGIDNIHCLIPDKKRKGCTSGMVTDNTTDISVEPVDELYYLQGPEYCMRYSFQIDGNQRFLLGDHTVTHNSTILENIAKIFYDIEDVGILSNNMEKKFGVWPLVSKKIFLGPEIKGNLSLEQAELQSMISGESMQIAEKNKPSRTVRFDVPGLCAGNETPNFTDNSGSMTRRIVVFPFNFKVKKGDTKLGKKIQSEIAYIIQASNRAYLKTINEVGKTGIWELLPEFFVETQEAMAENTNSLTHFLKTELVTLGNNGRDENGVELYCREKLFVAAFNDHCRESHFAPTKWTNQFYAGPFADFNLKVKKAINRRYPNKPGNPSYTGTFIYGVDVKESVIPVGYDTANDSD